MSEVLTFLPWTSPKLCKVSGIQVIVKILVHLYVNSVNNLIVRFPFEG